MRQLHVFGTLIMEACPSSVAGDDRHLVPERRSHSYARVRCPAPVLATLKTIAGRDQRRSEDRPANTSSHRRAYGTRLQARVSISMTEYIPVSPGYALNRRAHRVRVPVPRRVLDDAYTGLENGVMDPSRRHKRPWITEDIPVARIR
jgi:hypothetical protein